MEINHDRPVKIRPDCLFLGFTTSEHLGDLRIAKLSSLYHIVSLIYTDSCRIIQDNNKWIIQRHGYKTPAQVRLEQSQALALAA